MRESLALLHSAGCFIDSLLRFQEHELVGERLTFCLPRVSNNFVTKIDYSFTKACGKSLRGPTTAFSIPDFAWKDFLLKIPNFLQYVEEWVSTATHSKVFSTTTQISTAVHWELTCDSGYLKALKFLMEAFSYQWSGQQAYWNLLGPRGPSCGIKDICNTREENGIAGKMYKQKMIASYFYRAKSKLL